MKLGYLSGSLIPSGYANSVHVMHMCAALAGAGHDVTLYAKSGAPGKINPYAAYGVPQNFKLHRTPFGRTPFFSGAIRVAGIVLHEVLIGKHAVLYGRDATSLYACALMGRKTFFEAHQIPESLGEHRLWRKLFKNKNCLGVVVITHALKEDLLKVFPRLTEDKILVVADAASIPTPEQAALELPPWPGRQGHLQIGYTGSLTAGRGIEMIESLAQRLPEMDFHIIGGTHDQLQTIMARSPYQNLHLHGQAPHALIPSYLARFQYVLAPYQQQISIGSGADISRWISPMKLFEYMASGRPIICSDLPVLSEVLTHGVNALLVAADNPSAWVDAITYLQKHPDMALKMGAAAYGQLLNGHTWEKRATAVSAFMRHRLQKTADRHQ